MAPGEISQPAVCNPRQLSAIQHLQHLSFGRVPPDILVSSAVMKRLAVSVFAFAILTFTALAQVVPDRYILELAGEPAAAYAVRLGHRAHSADATFQSRVTALNQEHARMRQALSTKGARVTGETTAVTNMMFVQFPDSRSAELASIPGVKRVYPVQRYKL